MSIFSCNADGTVIILQIISAQDTLINDVPSSEIDIYRWRKDQLTMNRHSTKLLDRPVSPFHFCFISRPCPVGVPLRR
jgi:hypothetical protein